MADLVATAITRIASRDPEEDFESIEVRVRGEICAYEFIPIEGHYGFTNRDAGNVMQRVAGAINGLEMAWAVIVPIKPLAHTVARGRIGRRW